MAMNSDQATIEVQASMDAAMTYIQQNNIAVTDPQYMHIIMKSLIEPILNHIKNNAVVSIHVPQTQNAGIAVDLQEIQGGGGGNPLPYTVSVTSQGTNPEVNASGTIV